MSKPDIRWKQRFENYTKAVGQMTRFIEKGDLNEMEEQGLIQSFEYTCELAWTTLKDFFEDQRSTSYPENAGKHAANPNGVGTLWPGEPRVARASLLGFGPESRWDSWKLAWTCAQ